MRIMQGLSRNQGKQNTHDNDNDNDDNDNDTLIYIAPACRMTSEALADSSSRATEYLTEK